MLTRLKSLLAPSATSRAAPPQDAGLAASAAAAPPGAPAFATLTYPAPQIPAEQVQAILATVAPHSMVHTSGVEFFLNESVRVVRDGIPGAIVECGVWRGGAALACLLAQRAAFGRVERPVFLLDSFEGLPPVTAKDGPLAAAWQTGEDAERFMDNCRAAEEAVRSLLREHGFGAEEAIVLKGWFSETLPGLAERLRGDGLAILRLDGDWYDSTTECLEHLEPLVHEGGTVIVDDYYAWDGCARAVHDYLSRRDLAYRIKSLFGNYGMYFVKRAHRQSYEEF